MQIGKQERKGQQRRKNIGVSDNAIFFTIYSLKFKRIMKKLKPLLDFIQFSVSEKIAFYRNVIARMTDNPLFSNPDVSLTDAKAAVDELETNYLAAKDGGRTAISAMHGSEDKADNVFRILEAYVDRKAAGPSDKERLQRTQHPSMQIRLSHKILCHPICGLWERTRWMRSFFLIVKAGE